MHMADALLSPTVAMTMVAASAVATGVSIVELNKEEKLEEGTLTKKLPMMAVTSALIFAGQMVNFTIPGTGSSGHICGGFLAGALLGPWAGFLSMIVVLAIQCLLFADGGLMALGANVWNMAFYGCILGYFLIYRPLMNRKTDGSKRKNIIISSILGCVIGLQLGAFSVVLQTSLSGITELPFGAFVALMQPIHLAIGLVEGIVTAAVLVFVYESRPEMLHGVDEYGNCKGKFSIKTTVAILAIAAIVIGTGMSLLASGNPDGLEWSLFGNEEAGYSQNMGLDEEDYGVQSSMADKAGAIQESTSILPDYALKDSDSILGTSISGLVGMIVIGGIAAVICVAGKSIRKKTVEA